jgi:hypothetical protein
MAFYINLGSILPTIINSSDLQIPNIETWCPTSYTNKQKESDGRTQWSRGQRRVSAAARLLGCVFEFRRGHECLSVVSVVCSRVEVSATERSLVQRIPTECGVSEYDREASIMRRP